MSGWLGLEGKVAVVTGGNGGIGVAISRTLLEQGALVAMLDQVALSEEEVQARFGGDHAVRCISLACDVGDDDAVAAAARQVQERLGACSILVNNAAMTSSAPLDSVETEDWTRLLDVNVTGYLRCAKAFCADMRAVGDSAIVNIASIAGTQPTAYGGAYSTAKAAVLMLSRQLAFEWGPDGIRSNCVSPGLIRTPMSEAFYADEQSRERRENVVPSRRIGRPQDIADAVAFLASPRASYVNGADLVVDGGFTQTLMSHIPRART